MLVLIPSVAYIAAGAGTLASFVASSAALTTGFIPGLIFLPVTALWLAELNAD
jgi:hypothetical protein